MCFALSGVIFCLDFNPFFFFLLFPCRVFFLSYILIHLVNQSVSNMGWEGGFVFPRAQRCKLDGGSIF
jgi:hypothetical protein